MKEINENELKEVTGGGMLPAGVDCGNLQPEICPNGKKWDLKKCSCQPIK